MYILFCDFGRSIRSNDADEFYEAINIGNTRDVILRAHRTMECLAKVMIESLTSRDLW
jgi:hypothetical protein